MSFIQSKALTFHFILTPDSDVHADKKLKTLHSDFTRENNIYLPKLGKIYATELDINQAFVLSIFLVGVCQVFTQLEALFHA